GETNTLYYPNVDGFKVNAFRAYFHLSGASVREFILNFGDETTGIEPLTISPEGERTDGVLYDLQGRRVLSPLTPGLYIRNGKKVIII
ncbi:MAG: hypothetical protein IKM76_10405, partial [Prevotella sp.]|nr:hypothetical protein [Prevotella sp.]